MNLPEGWPTEEMVAAGFEVIHQAAPDERAFRIDLFRAMLAAAPTPPAQEDEPVACQIRLSTDYECDTWHQVPVELFERYLNDPQWQVRKLYTRPDEKLRKAAEEAIADWKKDILSGDGVVLKLIEALEGKSYPFKY